MGKKPEQQLDSSNSLSLPSKELRSALDSFFWAVEKDLFLPEEFSFELITKQTHFKVGRFNPESTKKEVCRKALDLVLRAVADGLVKTEEFRFVVDTDLFHIEAGDYIDVAFDDVLSSWGRDSSDSGDQIVLGNNGASDTDSSDCDDQIEVGNYVDVAFADLLSSWGMDLSDSGDQIELCINDDGYCSSDTDSRDCDNQIEKRHPFELFVKGVPIRFRWKKPPPTVILVLFMLMSPQTHGAMIYKAGDPVTLKEGDTGAIRFNDLWQPTDQSCDYVYVTIRFEGFNHPFYVDGSIDPEGLVTPNQVERFSVIPIREGCSLEIEFIIKSVRIEDEGTYVVEKIYFGASQNSVFIKRQIMVYIPPGPATCFFTKSEYSHTLHEVHCYTVPGNGNATLTCFQDGEKIPYQGEKAVVDRRIFWLMGNKPVSCCAHDIKDSNIITAKSCGQFKWPPITTKTTSHAPPILLTFPITERSDIEYIISETPRSGCTHAHSKFWPSVIPVVLTLMGCIPGY